MIRNKRPGFGIHQPSLWLTLVAGLALLGVLTMRMWGLAKYSRSVLRYPHQIDYDEGINLHASLLFSRGELIYIPLDPNRLVSAIYPPLYYVLAGIPLHWTGPSFVWGRAISLLATLGTAVLLGGMAARASRRWPIGVLCALFFLAPGPVHVWASFYKQDMLAIFFTVAGLYVVQRCVDRRSAYWAVPLFVLGFFSKQTAVFGPAVGALYVWVHDAQSVPGGLRKWAVWRRGLLFALASIAAIMIPFVVLDLLLHHTLYLHMFTFLKVPWVQERFMKNMGRLLGEYRYVLILDLCAAAYLVYRRKSLLCPLYLLVATAAIVVSCGHPAANYNHFLDIFPPLSLVFGAFLGELWRLRHRTAVQAVLFVSIAILLCQGLVLSKPQAWYRGLPTPELGDRMEGIENFLSTKPDPILSENVGLLLRSGHTVEYDDPWMCAWLARAGIWDERVLVEKIASGYYKWILLDYDITNLAGATRWSPKVFQALKENYVVLYRDCVFIYRPRRRN